MSDRDDGNEPRPAGSPDRARTRRSRGKKKRPRRGWARRWLPRFAVALLGLLVAGALVVVLVLRHYEADLPSVGDLRKYNPPQVTRILARDGTTLGELFVERRTVVSIDAVPEVMKRAVLAAEDAHFYEHDGLNYLGMLRALAHNLRHPGSLQGGSTITQQVVKNVLLSPERTFSRKAKEVILARQIEQTLLKHEILELYLNHIYFGHGRYGIEEASRFYFGKGVGELKLSEAALLAGIVKGPSIYSPRVSPARARSRRSFVLSQMAQKGFISAEDAEAAKSEPIAIAQETDVVSDLAPEVVEEVRRTLSSLVGAEMDRGGFTITTTIDPVVQRAARDALRKNLDDYAMRHKLVAPIKKEKRDPKPSTALPKSPHQSVVAEVVSADDAKGTIEVQVAGISAIVDVRDARYNPNKLKASELVEIGKAVRVVLLDAPSTDEGEGGGRAADEPSDPRQVIHARLELGPQGALVAIDVKTREILALAGSYEAVRGGLDRASRASRQPGSTFKPFTYGYAIHTRTMTPATLLETDPTAVAGYKPGLLAADESAARKPKRMREALAKSINVAAVWTIDRVGPANVAKWAALHGIKSKLGSDLSLALGSYEVTPREMVAAYATWAAGGEYQEPVLITKIARSNGTEVSLPEREPPRRVMEEAHAYLVTSLLTSVVQDGTGRRAKVLGRPIAGKTGTSNRAKDAWFVGYSADIACAAWTGFDDGTPLGVGESGASAALPAFVELMLRAHKERPVAQFREPSGIVHRTIDPETGLLAREDQENGIDEVFLAGTEPVDMVGPNEGAGGADAGVDDAGTDPLGAVAGGDETDAGETDPSPHNGDAGSLPPLLPVRSSGAPSPSPPPF